MQRARGLLGGDLFDDPMPAASHCNAHVIAAVGVGVTQCEPLIPGKDQYMIMFYFQPIYRLLQLSGSVVYRRSQHASPLILRRQHADRLRSV